jgi:hypothetical protein
MCAYYIPKEILGYVPEQPWQIKIFGHDSSVYWPRMFFVIRNLSQDYSGLEEDHRNALAEVLKTKRTSGAVKDTFNLLQMNSVIERDVASITGNKQLCFYYFTDHGKNLAEPMWCPVVDHDSDRINKSPDKRLPYEKGMVMHYAYFCRKNNIPVEVVPQMDIKMPPDLIVGEEKRWVYIYRRIMITKPSNLERIYKDIPDGQPVEILLHKPYLRGRLASMCAEVGVSPRFTAALTFETLPWKEARCSSYTPL